MRCAPARPRAIVCNHRKPNPIVLQPATSAALSVRDEDGRAANLPCPECGQGIIRLCEREGLYLRAYGNGGGEREKLLAIAAGEVRHGADDALLPEDVVRE